MAKKERLYDTPGANSQDEGVDSADATKPRVSLLDTFIGSLSKAHGLEQVAPTDAGEPKTLVYPQANGKILAGPPKEVPNVDNKFVRFYEDRTERPDMTNQEKMALLAIGLATPLLGYAMGGKVGGYAGGAAAAKGIGGALEKEDDYYKEIGKTKAINKSKVMTAAEMSLLGSDKGGKSVAGKVKYQWIPARDAKGQLVYRRVDRATGQVDKQFDVAGYKKEFYDNYVPGTNSGIAMDADGAEMPAPDNTGDAGFPSTKPGRQKGNIPPSNAADDKTFEPSDAAMAFNYDKQKQQPRPDDVADKLPKHVGSIETKEGKAAAEFLKENQAYALDDLMPSDRDLDPTPNGPESINAAKMRAENANKLKLKLIEKKADLDKDLAKAKHSLEAEARGDLRAKALSKYRLGLEKDLATFKNQLPSKGPATPAKRQVMKNAKGQLVDVVSGEVVDANVNAPKASSAGGGGAKAASVLNREEDKLAQFDTAIADMEDVLQKARSNWIGPLDGRLPAIDPDEAAFRSSVGQQLDSYRHVITGAGAGIPEIRKLESRLPGANDISLDVFKAKGNAYIEKMRRARDIYAKAHNLPSGDTAALKANLNEQKTQVAPSSGMVKFTAPDGTTMWIPKDREEYYRQKAAAGGK